MVSGSTISVRLGVDFSSLEPSSQDGVTTFSFGIVEGLLESLGNHEELVILASPKNESYFRERYSSSPVTILVIKNNIYARCINRMIWILSWVVHEFRLRYWYECIFRDKQSSLIEDSVDALIVPTTVLNYYALKIPSILCIHDIQQEYFPENFTFHQRLLRWPSYRLSCSRASLIQVSSLFIRDCLIEKFPFLLPEKLFIAPEGVNEKYFSLNALISKPNIPDNISLNRFIFYPAQLWRHKNHRLLLFALTKYKEHYGEEIICILTGHDFGQLSEIKGLCSGLGLAKVVYLGRVQFPELLWLYKNCSAVLALGLHESSSLPVREGAAFGRPIICVDIPPNVETSLSLYLTLVDQMNPSSLENALRELYVDGRVMIELAKKNVDLVKIFYWSKIVNIYREKITQLDSQKTLKR